MIKEIKNYERNDIFNYYHTKSNPFIIMTIDLDVTNVVNYCKANGNFYATMGYIISKAVHVEKAFRYRYDAGKFYFCPNIMVGYTEKDKNGNVGFFKVPFTEDYNDYIKLFLEEKQKFVHNKKTNFTNKLDEIWVSCFPWGKFSALIPPLDSTVSIPQFIWDKYEKQEDRYHMHLMIMVHHGFADGYHIAQFIDALNGFIGQFGRK